MNPTKIYILFHHRVDESFQSGDQDYFFLQLIPEQHPASGGHVDLSYVEEDKTSLYELILR